MYKKLKLSSFIPSIIICALLNLILFLTVPDARLESAVFWIGWGFAFPINIIIAVSIWIFIHSRTSARKEDTIVYLPLLTYVIFIATGVYLVFGIVFMYFSIDNVTVPLVLEAIITGAYAFVLYYALFIANRITGSQKETKQKVFYIRLLQSDLESCFSGVSDASLLAKLRELAEKLRFSDPMSHPSLADCEQELSKVIMNIVTKVNSSDLSGIDTDIAKAESLIAFRNNRCKILK